MCGVGKRDRHKANITVWSNIVVVSGTTSLVSKTDCAFL